MTGRYRENAGKILGWPEPYRRPDGHIPSLRTMRRGRDLQR